MVSPLSVRLTDPVSTLLSAFMKRVGWGKSTVVNIALDEWLRMQDHAGIRFVTTETGERRAALANGPQVWSVAEAWLQQDAASRTPAAVAHLTGLTTRQVDQALAYWADFRQEIDTQIEREHRYQDDALAAWNRRRALDAA